MNAIYDTDTDTRNRRGRIWNAIYEKDARAAVHRSPESVELNTSPIAPSHTSHLATLLAEERV